MIFVTVGNADQGFLRLLGAVDTVAGEGIFNGEEVIVQKGNSPFVPRHVRSNAFFPMDQFEKLVGEASLVICHGGCTVLQLLRMKKYPVVMPRMRKFGEHVNNHQVEFVLALAGAGYVVPVFEAAELRDAVLRARGGAGRLLPPSRMPELMRATLSEMLG